MYTKCCSKNTKDFQFRACFLDDVSSRVARNWKSFCVFEQTFVYTNFAHFYVQNSCIRNFVQKSRRIFNIEPPWSSHHRENTRLSEWRLYKTVKNTYEKRAKLVWLWPPSRKSSLQRYFKASSSCRFLLKTRHFLTSGAQKDVLKGRHMRHRELKQTPP